MPEQSVREYVRLPVGLANDFHRVADVDGYTPASLLLHWELSAVEVLEQGRRDLLPLIERVPHGQLGPLREFRFTRGAAESERCRAAMVASGLDRNDVDRAAVRLYVMAGGMRNMVWIRIPTR